MLWSYERILSQAPSGSSNGIIGTLVNAALTAAFVPYEPIADKNATQMLKTLPQGVHFGKW
jgi:hypothetical protein